MYIRAMSYNRKGKNVQIKKMETNSQFLNKKVIDQIQEMNMSSIIGGSRKSWESNKNSNFLHELDLGGVDDDVK